jgi:molybdate transport system substrate-binding protein
MRQLQVAFFVILAAALHAQAAEIKVLSTTAVKEALIELTPQFEKASGHKLSITWSSSSVIRKQIPEGGKFDLVITSAPDIGKFVVEQSVMPDSQISIGRTGVAIANKDTSPKLDVSTAEKVKQAILDAKGIVYSSGPSGIYVEQMIGKMGILEKVKPNLKQTPPGARSATLLVSGEADLGFQQMSEFVHERGINILGYLPSEIQNWTTWSTGIPKVAEQIEPAKSLQIFLTGAGPVWKSNGIEPPPK